MGHRLDEAFEGLPDRLSVEGLAKVLGIDKQTTYRWLQEGRVPAYKVGKNWVILRDEVKDFLEASSNQRHRGQPEAPEQPAQSGEQSREQSGESEN